MNRIGFVGAGNMARALGAGLRRRDPSIELLASDALPESLEAFRAATGGRAVADNQALIRGSDVVVLAVKPQVMRPVLAEIAPALDARHLIVSIAAGIDLATMQAALGPTARIVRAMPNTPALVGQGMSVLVGGPGVGAEDLALAEALLATVGDAVRVGDEALLDAVTATSGSGPGYVFAFAEQLVAGAVEEGLEPALAERLVRQTLLGSATLWAESGENPASLRAKVTSPGGTTQAGLEALASGGFAAAVRAAIAAASRRSRELARG